MRKLQRLLVDSVRDHAKKNQEGEGKLIDKLDDTQLVILFGRTRTFPGALARVRNFLNKDPDIEIQKLEGQIERLKELKQLHQEGKGSGMISEENPPDTSTSRLSKKSSASREERAHH